MTNIIPVFAIGVIFGSICFFLGGYFKQREYNIIQEVASDMMRKSADYAILVYRQNDEILQLKKTKDHLITENNGLKNKNKNQKNRLKQYKENNRKLKKENKQLKKDIKNNNKNLVKIDCYKEEIQSLHKAIQLRNQIIEEQTEELCQEKNSPQH